MRPVAALLGVLVTVGLSTSAWAHEERLVIGEIQKLDLQRNLLVVHDPERDRTMRLAVDADTQVQRCRRGLLLTAVQVGTQVRVKYVDSPGGELQTLSILILPGRRQDGKD